MTSPYIIDYAYEKLAAASSLNELARAVEFSAQFTDEEHEQFFMHAMQKAQDLGLTQEDWEADAN